MDKLSNDAKAETSPESTPASEIARLRREDFATMEEIVERRTRLGEYGTETGDILAIAKIVRRLVIGYK